MQLIEGTWQNYLACFTHFHTVPLANSREIDNVLVTARIALPEDTRPIAFNGCSNVKVDGIILIGA